LFPGRPWNVWLYSSRLGPQDSEWEAMYLYLNDRSDPGVSCSTNGK
jgi:hypothetical protein